MNPVFFRYLLHHGNRPQILSGHGVITPTPCLNHGQGVRSYGGEQAGSRELTNTAARCNVNRSAAASHGLPRSHR